MKMSHQCPKCRSERVFRFKGSVGTYGEGNNIKYGFTTFKAVPLDRYLCLACGYSEDWLSDKALAQLRLSESSFMAENRSASTRGTEEEAALDAPSSAADAEAGNAPPREEAASAWPSDSDGTK